MMNEKNNQIKRLNKYAILSAGRQDAKDCRR
jgi:hypothetical protein